jgi:hypothetical protein
MAAGVRMPSKYRLGVKQRLAVIRHVETYGITPAVRRIDDNGDPAPRLSSIISVLERAAAVLPSNAAPLESEARLLDRWAAP